MRHLLSVLDRQHLYYDLKRVALAWLIIYVSAVIFAYATLIIWYLCSTGPADPDSALLDMLFRVLIVGIHSLLLPVALLSKLYFPVPVFGLILSAYVCLRISDHFRDHWQHKNEVLLHIKSTLLLSCCTGPLFYITCVIPWSTPYSSYDKYIEKQKTNVHLYQAIQESDPNAAVPTYHTQQISEASFNELKSEYFWNYQIEYISGLIPFANSACTSMHNGRRSGRKQARIDCYMPFGKWHALLPD